MTLICNCDETTCAHCSHKIEIEGAWEDNSGELICYVCKEKEDEDIEKWYKNLSYEERKRLSEEFTKKIEKNRVHPWGVKGKLRRSESEQN